MMLANKFVECCFMKYLEHWLLQRMTKSKVRFSFPNCHEPSVKTIV